MALNVTGGGSLEMLQAQQAALQNRQFQLAAKAAELGISIPSDLGGRSAEAYLAEAAARLARGTDSFSASPGGGNLNGLMQKQEQLHNHIQAMALKSAMDKALHDAAMQIIGNM